MASRRACAMVVIVAVLACLPVTARAAQKECRYILASGGSFSLVNEYGPVNLQPATGREVLITAYPASGKVQIECVQHGNRVDVRTHFLQPTSADEGRVEYRIQVPPDANISVRTGSGPVRVEKLRGDVTLEGDGASIDLRNLNNTVLHARTVSGNITVANVSHSHVDVTSVSGNVTLTNVTGPKVTVNTTKGAIAFAGDCAGGGEYSLSNHSGNIVVSLPANASVELSARSLNGKVDNEFPFQPNPHPAAGQGHAFAGTSNSGASALRLHSFNGTITVKKQ